MINAYSSPNAEFPDIASPPISPRTQPIAQSDDARRIMDNTEGLDGDIIMKVGKYRGRTFENISRDKFYTRWVRQQEFPRGPLAALKKWLDKNANWLLERNMAEALQATGPLSNRIRAWDVEEMRTRGILSSMPQINTSTFGKTRRPRAPMYSLQESGVIKPWEAGMSKGDKWALRCTTALVARFLSYVFRRMIHEVRGDDLMEPLIADRALLVIERNDYAYRLALKLSSPQGDPEGLVLLETLEEALQSRRETLRLQGKPDTLPESLRPCFSRLGCQGQGVYAQRGDPTEAQKVALTTTPRRILLRFMLSIGELREALSIYRDIHNRSWNTPEVLKACWCMARGDGAFDYDRISNEELPIPLLASTSLKLYQYMLRCVENHFGKHKVSSIDMHYGPCLGFGDTGCPLEADIRVGSTVYAIRGGLWISAHYDVAYLQGYAALARSNSLRLDRCVIIYLQHGSTFEFDLSDWDHLPLLEFLKNDPSSKRGLDACDLGLCEPNLDETDEIALKKQKIQKRELRRNIQLGERALDV